MSSGPLIDCQRETSTYLRQNSINCRRDATDKTHQTMTKQMASTNENLQLEADEMANVLRVRYVGHVSARSMEAAFLGAGRILDLMRPRFLVLTDMSRVEAFEKMCVPYIGKLMDLFMEKGMGSVVRAVPDPTKDIGFNILGRFHYGPGVSVVTFESLDEAEAYIRG